MTQQLKKYVVRRTTSEEQATAALNEASEKGFVLDQAVGGGGDLNVLWMIFSTPRTSADAVPPPPVPAAPVTPAGPAGGSFE